MEYLRVKLDHETVNCVIFFGKICRPDPFPYTVDALVAGHWVGRIMP